MVADHRLSQISTASSTNSKRAKAQIGPWQLGRTLGRGSSGRVRLAKHSETGKLAAVKIVPKAPQPDEVSRASESYGIEREVIIMKLIEHPNIMGLFDVWENKGELYLVLEYIEGGELFDYLISRGRLSEREAVHYFRQICYGVDYCHRFNICHRDLKPENLLLDKHRNIKIADFGMAALEANGRLLETSCGSPHYASPEIVSGKNYHGAPSDIWSCGIILFALLTGHLPFDDDNIRQLLLKVQTGRFTMPRSLSAEAQDLISQMLVVNPMERICMPDILNHPLLKKYPPRYIPAENLEKRMPRLDVAQRITHIDREILRNLQTLWPHSTRDELIQQLRKTSPNTEKVFYALLVRFRQRHGLSSRDPLPRNKSVASLKSMRSSKSVRSLASSTRGSMKSLKSVRSSRSARSIMSTRRRRSPTKPVTKATARRSPSFKENTDVFAQILEQAFNPHARIESEPRTTYNENLLGKRRPSPTKPTAAAPRTTTSSAPSSAPAAAPTPASTAPAAAATPSTADVFDIDFDFSNENFGLKVPSEQTYLLPMIFEEDRFADAIEEEMEQKINSRRAAPASAAATNKQPGDDSQLKISNIVAGESFLSYQPSPAAAAVSAPVRAAPRAPSARASSSLRAPSLMRAPSGPRDMPSRKPVAVYKDPSIEQLERTYSTDRMPLAPLKKDDARLHLQDASREPPAEPSHALKDAPAGQKPKPAQTNILKAQQKAQPKPIPRPTDEDLKVRKRDEPTEKKLSWIRRLTPRIVSRRSSKDEKAKTSEKSSNLASAPSKPPAPKTPAPKTSAPKTSAPSNADKENIGQAPVKSSTAQRRASRASHASTASSHEEPRQNWFMKMLSSSTQSSMRTFHSSCQSIELRAIVLELLNEWSPSNLAVYNDGSRGDPIIVSVLRTNNLHLKPAQMSIDIRQSHSGSTAKLMLRKGSRSSFTACANEMTRRLKEMNVVEIN